MKKKNDEANDNEIDEICKKVSNIELLQPNENLNGEKKENLNLMINRYQIQNWFVVEQDSEVMHQIINEQFEVNSQKEINQHQNMTNTESLGKKFLENYAELEDISKKMLNIMKSMKGELSASIENFDEGIAFIEKMKVKCEQELHNA